MRLPLHIGIDDTDSVKGGCTTYIAAVLVEKLQKVGKFLDYPKLIRLNPNVPWKTRGNAALALHISIDEKLIDEGIWEVVDTVEKMSQLDQPRTDPGIVFFVGNIPDEFACFSRRTIQDVVRKKEALDLIKRFGAEAVGFKGGRGIIGALAAVGEALTGDYTFELIAYRIADNIGKPRQVNSDSVFKMDVKMTGLTFNNIDSEKRRVLLAPRGPDPVLLGLRGETLDAVKKAFQMLDIGEEVERWVVFRTNQGTDAHLRRVDGIAKIRPYRPVIVVGSVVSAPHNIPGRHVIFTIKDNEGCIDCAAYEPTGKFRNIIKKLTAGDVVEVYGGVRRSTSKNPKTINLEKIRVVSLTPKFTFRNPTCSICGKSMESMGRSQGFRCKKCGLRVNGIEKIQVEVERYIENRLYIPPPRAHRHLTKPMSRYGLEKTDISFPPRDFWGLGTGSR